MNLKLIKKALTRWEAYIIFFIPFITTEKHRAIQQILIFTIIYLISWRRVCRERQVLKPTYGIGLLRGIETSAVIAFIVRAIFINKLNLYTKLTESVVGFLVYQFIISLQIHYNVIQCTKYVHYDTLKEMMDFTI